MNTKLYIILVNYNGHLDTIECLESIMKQNGSNFQVIVVDNSKTECYLTQISKWSNGQYNDKINTQFPEIIYPLSTKPIPSVIVNEKGFLNKDLTDKLILVKALQNKGFAAANNIALKYIQRFGKNEDLIWFLNNDTIISKATMQDVVFKFNAFKGDKHKTLFGTPLLEYYDPKQIQAVGGHYNRFFGSTSHLGEGLKYHNGINTSQFNVDYPIGASMMVTNSFIKTVGLLNEDYFLFYEELDRETRLRKKNGRVKILNVFGVLHKQGKTTNAKNKGSNSKSEFIDLLLVKNRISFTKNYYKKHIGVVIFSILTTTILKRIIKGNIKRAIKIFNLVMKEIFLKHKKREKNSL